MSTTHYSELMMYELVMDWVYELGVYYPMYERIIEIEQTGDGEIAMYVPAGFENTEHYQDLKRMILEPNKTSGKRTGWNISSGNEDKNHWITIWSK